MYTPNPRPFTVICDGNLLTWRSNKDIQRERELENMYLDIKINERLWPYDGTADHWNYLHEVTAHSSEDKSRPTAESTASRRPSKTPARTGQNENCGYDACSTRTSLT